MIRDLTADLSFAWRRARRRPLVPSVTVLTIAISVAAVTGVFAVADTILLRPLPLPDSDRIVRFHTTFNGPEGYVPAVNLFDLRDVATESETLAFVAPYQVGSATWRTDAGPQPVSLVSVGLEFADVIGLPLELGRRFAPEEFAPGAGDVAIVTHGFWQRALGGSSDALGRALNLDGRLVTVVGVLPDAPYLHPVGRDIWLPLVIEPDSYLNNRQSVALAALGRIRPEAAPAAAEAELAALDGRLRTAYPDTSGQRSMAMHRLADDVAGPVRGTVVLLAVAVVVVLLIAAANVADLLLGDAIERRREFALRAAIGGATARLTRQVLVEGLVLAAAGGAAGFALAPVFVTALVDLYPVSLPRVAEIGVDLRVAAIATAATALAGLLASIPLVHATRRRDLLTSLQVSARATGTRRTRRLASSLVAAQVAASVVLLFAASLFLRSFVATARTDLGINTANTIAFRVLPTGDRYESPEAVSRLYDQLTAGLRALPGVEAAGVTGFLPLAPGMWGDDFARVGTDDTPPDLPAMTVHFMTPGLPRALGVPVVEGRAFSDLDRADAPLVVVVNQALAARYFNGDPVGREVVWMDDVRRIVGVIGDKRHAGLHEPPEPEMWVPLAQFPRSPGWAVVRAEGEPSNLFAAAAAIVNDLDPDLPMTRQTTLDAHVASARAPERFRAALAGVLGLVAAGLAGLGLYGVLTHLVTSRTRELGVRMALGASSRRLQRGVLQQAGRLIAVGGALGAVGAFVSAGWIRSLLPPGGEVADPLAIIVASIAMIVLAAAAAWLPARRASRVDPLTALRAD